jgi:hypothetical protein
MKSFYSPVVTAPPAAAAGSVVPSMPIVVADEARPVGLDHHIGTRARIAVYDARAAAPRVVDIEPGPVGDFIERLAVAVHELSRSAGGEIPYTVVREVTENFIHADFAEPVVSIMDEGSTIRFADQGPGISDKDRALLPGFTTAHGEMKQYIRGVGSGLPIVREYLIHSGGSLAIEDNLGAGSVVTVYSGPRASRSTAQSAVSPVVPSRVYSPQDATPVGQASFTVEDALPEPTASPRLSARQKHVLALVLESGLAGPSLVSKELGVGISTAYRDLAYLEGAGLIVSDAGKRTLTEEGLSFLGDLMNRS